MSALNREQVRFICEEMARIQKLPLTPKHSTPGPEEQGAFRGPAMEDLARRVGMGARQLYSLMQGRVHYARPWVYEWAREQRKVADANGAAEIPHRIRGQRIPEVTRAKAKEMHARGASYPEIAKATGIPTGSMTYVIHGPKAERDQKRAKARRVVVPEKRKAAARISKPAPAPKPRTEDWGENFRRYVEAEEEKARAALTERHAREREALEEELTAKRQTVVERLLELYTHPGLRAPTG